MTYVLGTLGVVNAPLRLQFTCQGDDFYSLGRAYGVSGPDILQMQPELKGRTITKKVIQDFVKSRAGWNNSGMRPYSAKDNPGTKGSDGKPEGYAIFTSATQLMLPDMPRLDGKGASASPASVSPVRQQEDVSEAGLGRLGGFVTPAIVVGFGAITALLILAGKKAKKAYTARKARTQTVA